MIKILHFISDTNIGGAGVLLCRQIRGIDCGKFQFTVALPRGSALIEKLSSLPCKIIQLKSGADRSFSLDSVAESYQVIKSERPDIVHSHGSLSSRIAATLLQVPCRVLTRHCAPEIPKALKNPFVKSVFGCLTSLLSTSIVATADCAKSDLVKMGCDGKKIITVINGSPPLRLLSDNEKAFFRSKYGLSEENFVISIFARLDEGKGHKTLLQAAQICKKTHPNFRFFIVGCGSFEKYLKRFAHSLNIDDVVHFTGFCDDVSPIFNITDINVNCSYISETSSLSLSEGMSIGIPSVVSDVGGNPYMVKNEENGLVFPANCPRALANALIRLYEDNALYKKCSTGAIRRYKNELNDKRMCKKMAYFYLKIYREKKSK